MLCEHVAQNQPVAWQRAHVHTRATQHPNRRQNPPWLVRLSSFLPPTGWCLVLPHDLVRCMFTKSLTIRIQPLASACVACVHVCLGVAWFRHGPQVLQEGTLALQLFPRASAAASDLDSMTNLTNVFAENVATLHVVLPSFSAPVLRMATTPAALRHAQRLHQPSHGAAMNRRESRPAVGVADVGLLALARACGPICSSAPADSIH